MWEDKRKHRRCLKKKIDKQKFVGQTKSFKKNLMEFAQYIIAKLTDLQAY
jgi:hypothetical protein